MLSELLESLDSFKLEAEGAFLNAASKEELEKARVAYLGKKGKISEILKRVGTLSPEERPQLGKRSNEIKAALERTISSKAAELLEASRTERFRSETLDLSLPGRRVSVGSLHPVTTIMQEISAALVPLGFVIEEGPVIEIDY